MKITAKLFDTSNIGDVKQMIQLTKTDLKKRLLDLHIVCDVEFLDKYCELILTNISSTNVDKKTTSHHFIPVAYYGKIYNEKKKTKQISLADNDVLNFRVNLTYCDHVLAHWYLFKCSSDSFFSYINSYAVMFMLKVNALPESESEILQNIINIGEIYSNFCTYQSENHKGGPKFGHSVSEETRLKISTTLKAKNKSAWNKGLTKETDERVLKNANAQRGKLVSQETRDRISLKLKGKSKILSEEQRAAMSCRMLGNTYGFTQGQNPWNKGIKYTAEQKKNLVKTRVLCVETGEIFESITDAKIKYRGDIHAACAGRQKTAAGYHWKILKD